MMKIRILYICILIFAFYNCKSTATLAEIEALKKTVSSKNFTIISDFANPVAFANVRGIENLLPPGSNLASISLINNQNNFTIKNDSVFLDMPFYGERRFGGAYGSSESGLEFKGKPTSFKETFNTKKSTYEFEFQLNNKNESLRVFLTLFVNNTSKFTVNSTHRSTISYTGKWKNLKE